jgi:hypothetical protein
MPLTQIIKTLRDASGNVFSGRFRADSSGYLAPEHHVVGDDGAFLGGSASDTAWDASASSPTWTAILKRMVLGSIRRSATVTFSRPSDSTAYTAGSVVGTSKSSTAAIEFANMGLSGENIVISAAALRVDLSAVPSGMSSFRIYLYSVTPPSALVDGASWDLPSGDRSSFLGFIDFDAVIDMGSTLYAELNGINKAAQLSGTSLFGYLVTNGACTITASTSISCVVHSKRT